MYVCVPTLRLRPFPRLDSDELSSLEMNSGLLKLSFPAVLFFSLSLPPPNFFFFLSSLFPPFFLGLHGNKGKNNIQQMRNESWLFPPLWIITAIISYHSAMSIKAILAWSEICLLDCSFVLLQDISSANRKIILNTNTEHP